MAIKLFTFFKRRLRSHCPAVYDCGSGNSRIYFFFFVWTPENENDSVLLSSKMADPRKQIKTNGVRERKQKVVCRFTHLAPHGMECGPCRKKNGVDRVVFRARKRLSESGMNVRFCSLESKWRRATGKKNRSNSWNLTYKELTERKKISRSSYWNLIYKELTEWKKMLFSKHIFWTNWVK